MEKLRLLIPVAQVAFNVGCGVLYLVARDWWRAGYWLLAAAIGVCVAMMR